MNNDRGITLSPAFLLIPKPLKLYLHWRYIASHLAARPSAAATDAAWRGGGQHLFAVCVTVQLSWQPRYSVRESLGAECFSCHNILYKLPPAASFARFPDKK